MVQYDRLLYFEVSKNIFYYAKRVGFRQGKVLSFIVCLWIIRIQRQNIHLANLLLLMSL